MKKIVLVLALFFAVSIVADTYPTGTALSSTTGRYVFGQISDYQRDKFMLDTKTGALWHVVKDDYNSTLLEPIYYVNIMPNGKTKFELIPSHDTAKK